MEHSQAVEHHMVEQYLLGEMPPQSIEAFEEHLFDCEECAAEAKVTAAFLAAARIEFEKPVAKALNLVPRSAKWSGLLSWRQAIPLYALAASLLFVAYQNTVVYPKLKSEVARLEAPEVLTSISLVGGNSRGGDVPSAVAGKLQSVELLVDIPAQDRFASYTCLLYSPNHELVSTIPISLQEAKDTVHIRVPTAGGKDGMYSLQVKGITPSNAAIDLAQYSFVLNSGPSS